MSNTLAIWLGLLLLAVVALDWLLFEWSILIFAMRGLAELIKWAAFWR
jgi:hypothetical protein